jgi:UPF0716 protein FxsA
VLRRLPVILCAAVAMDLMFFGLFSYYLDWKIALTELTITTVVGLAVIGYYEWRWSGVVAKHLESEPGLLDTSSLERLLLLIAGIVLLIPGVLTDVLGLLLLVPWVRRFIARQCHLYH